MSYLKTLSSWLITRGGWLCSGLCAAFVFVGSCVALQCGALAFSPIRHDALWLLALSFGALTLLALAILCIEASSAAARLFGHRRFAPVGFVLSAVAVVTGVALVFTYAPPGEPILGAADQGIYLASGMHLARTGSYGIDAPILRETPSALLPWVLGHEPAEAQRRSGEAPRFWSYDIGFFLDPQPAGDPPGLLSSKVTINPQFPPGFPLLLAAAYEVGGWKGLALANRVLMILAAALLGLLASRWLPPRGVIGLCVFLIALFQPLNLWIARSFFAESAVLCFWLLAILAWAHRRVFGETTAGVLAGIAVAAGLYVKFDTLLAGSLMGLCVLFASSYRFKRAFLAASVIVGLGALLAWRQFSWPNFHGTLTALGQSRMLWLLAVGVLVLGAFRYWQSRSNADRAGFAIRRYPPLALGALVLALATYAYWFRPSSSETAADHFYFWPFGGLIRSYREETFFRLGWYWQPFGLAVAVLGVALLGSRLRRTWQKAFFWVGLVSLVLFCYDLRNNPLQPYAMRRLLTAAMPCLILGATAFIPIAGNACFARWRFLKRVTSVRVTGGATVLGTIALLVGFAAINSRLNTSPAEGNFAGLATQTAQLARRLPSNSIVVIRRNAPLTALATPLQIIEGIDTILINPASHSRPYQEAFAKAWQEWTKRGRRVYLLSGVAHDGLDLFGAQFTSMERGTIRFPIVLQSPARLNTEATQVEWEYFLEELKLPESDAAAQ